MIHITPNLNEEILKTIYDNEKLNIRAVILRAYGAGNLPDTKSSQLINHIKKGKERGILTFFITQCANGNVKDYYESSAGLIGAIGCEDMTLPAATAKIAYILGKVSILNIN